MSFENPGSLPNSRRKSLKGGLKGRRGSAANLAQMCQPWARATPDTPSVSWVVEVSLPLPQPPMTGSHLQPARATPGEAASSVLSFQQLHPSIPYCLLLPARDPICSYSPQPTTKSSTGQSRQVLTLEGMSTSVVVKVFAAAMRQWRGPRAPSPHPQTSAHRSITQHRRGMRVRR